MSKESLHQPDDDDVKMPALEAHNRSTSIIDTDHNMLASESIDQMNDEDFHLPSSSVAMESNTDFDSFIEWSSHSFNIPSMPSLPPPQSTGTTPPIARTFSDLSDGNASASDYLPNHYYLQQEESPFDNEASMRYNVGSDVMREDFFSTPPSTDVLNIDDEDNYNPFFGAEEEAYVTLTRDATSATLLSSGGGYDGSPWSFQFEHLKQYKAEHGHCNVPQKHSELSGIDDGVWKGLGSWVNKVSVYLL